MSKKRFLTVLALAGVFGLSAAANAVSPAPPEDEITCQATHQISCSGDGACASEASDTIYVNFRYSPTTLSGDLCTYTYCRGYTLLPQPTAAGQASPPHTGFTLSDRAGSTEDDEGVPLVDFQLSLNAARTQFVLVNVEDGRTGGWAGACTPTEP
ncbi:MAG TPA: hypothetical protein PLK37_02385 [Terricaulis sp.]|nr:hypothetical protein [Terricaulis sp.]